MVKRVEEAAGSVAVMIDLENAFHDLRDHGSVVCGSGLRGLLSELSALGRVDWVVGVGDRYLCRMLVTAARELGVRLHPGPTGPDRADGEIVARLRNEVPESLGHLVLVSGDGGFVPVVRELQAEGRTVTVAGLRGHMSAQLQMAANRSLVLRARNAAACRGSDDGRGADDLPGLVVRPVPPRLPARRAAGQHLLVEERPSPTVPELQFSNGAPQPVLVLEGETVSGLQQDRTLNASVLVPPADTIVAPVSCIESGRWGHGSMNRAEGHTSPGLRTSKTRSVNLSRRRGAWDSDQGEVWSEVERLRRVHAAEAPTSSYHDVRDQAMRTRPLLVPEPLEGQRGVMFGIGGRVRAFELFDRSSTFRDYWPGLFQAAMTEAISAPPRPTPSWTARRCADRVSKLRFDELRSRGLGVDLHATKADLVASGLHWEGRVVHLAAFWELAA